MEVLKVLALAVKLLSPAPSIADSKVCFCPSPPSLFASLDGGGDDDDDDARGISEIFLFR
jgi:hypothetical protein